MPSLDKRGQELPGGQFHVNDKRQQLITELDEWIDTFTQIQGQLPRQNDEAASDELDAYVEYFTEISMRFVSYSKEIQNDYFDTLNYISDGIRQTAMELIEVAEETAVFLETGNLDIKNYRRSKTKIQIQRVLSVINNLIAYCEMK